MDEFNPDWITGELERHSDIYRFYLGGLTPEEYHWRPAPDKWSLLEIVCHLYDEEREDFRARVRHVLETPEAQMPGIDPPGWVSERRYAEQDFDEKLEQFLTEREQSVAWLRALEDNEPAWDNEYDHPQLGILTAAQLLANWLAHDYFHFRQITRLRYQYLHERTGQDLSYAGAW